MLPITVARYVSSIVFPKTVTLLGRVAAVRVKYPDGRDWQFFSVYAWPEIPGRDPDPRNVQIWNWVRERIEDAPVRCTPVVLTDANGYVGWSADPEREGAPPWRSPRRLQKGPMGLKRPKTAPGRLKGRPGRPKSFS